MIFSEPFRPFLKSEKPGRCHDPGLPPRRAEQDLQPTRFPDELTVTDEHRPDRCAEPLGQAEHHRRDMLGVLRNLGSGDRAGVEDPGPVQVERHTRVSTRLGDRRHVSDRGDGPAGHLMRVLDRDQINHGDVVPIRRQGRRDLIGGQRAALAIQSPERDAGKHRRRAQLHVAYVGRALAGDQVPGPHQGVQRDLSAQRAGRKVKGGLLAGELRGPVLQSVDRGVIAEPVIADFGRCHRLTHSRGRTGNGI